MNQVLNHMGHTWDVHRDYYRQYSSIAERLDVTKILLIQDQDKVHEYSKKGLGEIDIARIHSADFSGKVSRNLSDSHGCFFTEFRWRLGFPHAYHKPINAKIWKFSDFVDITRIF